MNTEHFNQWVLALRSGAYKQGTNLLHSVAPMHADDQLCCLGLGSMLAGLDGRVLTPDEATIVGSEHAPHDFKTRAYLSTKQPRKGIGYLPDPTHPGLYWCVDQQPDEFNKWLGLPPGAIVLDADADLFASDVDTHYDGFRHGSNFLAMKGVNQSRLPLYELNDGGFTFPQIADLIQFFGIAAVE